MKSLSQPSTTSTYFQKFQSLCDKLGNAGISPEVYNSFNTLQWRMAEFRMQCDDKEFEDAAKMLIIDFPKSLNKLKRDISMQHANPGIATQIIDEFLPQLEKMQKSLCAVLQKQQPTEETKINRLTRMF